MSQCPNTSDERFRIYTILHGYFPNNTQHILIYFKLHTTHLKANVSLLRQPPSSRQYFFFQSHKAFLFIILVVTEASHPFSLFHTSVFRSYGAWFPLISLHCNFVLLWIPGCSVKAPEMLKGDVVGPPADIWSVGVLTYIMWVWCHPRLSSPLLQLSSNCSISEDSKQWIFCLISQFLHHVFVFYIWCSACTYWSVLF